MYAMPIIEVFIKVGSELLYIDLEIRFLRNNWRRSRNHWLTEMYCYSQAMQIKAIFALCFLEQLRLTYAACIVAQALRGHRRVPSCLRPLEL